MESRLRLTTLALVAVLLAGCTGDDAGSIEAEGTDAPDARATLPNCGTIDIASHEYGTEISLSKGPPGTEVTLSGTTFRGEDGRWAPSDRLEAWWNTDVPEGEVGRGNTPIRPGPIVQLVVVENMERCRFEAAFEVPEALPGRYRISVFVWDKNPDDGYGFLLPHHFTVTDQ